MKYLIVPRLSQRGAHIKRFMNGDPSRRLQQVSFVNHKMQDNILIKKDFAMINTCVNLLSNSSDTEGVCLGTLKESAVAPQNITHSVLRSAVKFWYRSITARFPQFFKQAYLLKQKQWDYQVSKGQSSRILLLNPPKLLSNSTAEFQ